MQKQTIVFFGSSDFSIPCLTLLHQHYNIACVYTQQPQKKGRGMEIQKTPVHIFADKFSLPVKTPHKLTSEDENYLLSIKPDFLIVVSYGLLLPSFVLNTAKFSLNIHPSDLPKYRGAAPIERAIENCENTTKLCIIKMTKKLDAGDILHQSHDIDIQGKNSTYLTQFFAKMGADAMLSVLQNGSSCNIKQDDSKKIYAHKITKHDLEPQKDAIANLTTKQMLAKIMAFTTHGYIKVEISGKICKIVDAIILNAINAESIMHQTKCNQKQAAKIAKYAIECKDGFIMPTILIPQNSKQMQFIDFINGLN